MADSANRAIPEQPSTGAPGRLSRRRLLQGAAVTMGAAALGAGAAAPSAAAADASVTATAPDGSNTITMSLTSGALSWSAKRRGATVVDASTLGLKLSDGTVLGAAGTVITNYQHWTIDNTWTPVYGRNATVRDRYQEMRWNLQDTASLINFSLQIRAYPTGVAFRYVLLGKGTATVADELTTFAFPDSTLVYSARDEDLYNPVAPGSIPSTGTSTTDNGPLTDLPLTATYAGGSLIACICESSRLNFPRLMLSSVSGQPGTLAAYLMEHTARGSDTVQTTSTVTTPFATPWRAVVTGSTHAELVDNAELVLNLAPANALADTSWIKPGKAFRVQLTTAAGMAGVDFAVARGLQFIEYDGGWYGDVSSTDATKPIAAIDLPSVISYATSKGIGVILYVDRRAAGNPDSLFSLYKSWGVAGVKLGFVDDGTQAMTNQITNWARTAATYHLLIDMHDDMRPFGYERTYPNWVSMEGVRGNENFPTASHNVTLPFARNIGGPMDYTICYGQSRDRTTNVHQMAMAAVFYQPLNFLYWYDSPSKFANTSNWPGLPWFDAIPTTWDQSHALAGSIGQYAAVARRHGDTWFLGAMTNETSRTLSLPLTFLGGGTYTATVYADGTPGTSAYQTPVVVSTRTVTSATTLNVAMAPAGGQAIILKPS
ncbi:MULTISPECIES: glycoside hydrolase family 97 protein [unclassified Streptomyces]|uniref:glycoside hydrolase family 97 protein n=1 Tax=unclassified Streptomyces TaxID=2593676 RepID=UPI00225B050B|nr:MULTISPECIES: glycoside hydrolase family 97 protein [unclassified Streptomyces]MCX5052641.1 glycoside hydrolase family 97 protein [Streptomyces sp. NBC_00474]